MKFPEKKTTKSTTTFKEINEHPKNFEDENSHLIETPKTYSQRWFILFIFSLNTFMDGIMFVSLSGINNIASRYYSVSPVHIEWLTNMVTMTILGCALPTSIAINKYGIKPFLIAHALFILIGTSVRCFAKQYWLLVLAQVLPAIGSALALQTPGRLSAIWFAEGERATATSIGVSSMIFGGAIGFVYPPLVVKMHLDRKKTGNELFVLYVSQMILSAIIFFMTLLYKEKPPTPPCLNPPPESISFRSSIKLLSRDKYFVLLSQSFGINVGVLYSLPALINPIITSKYPVGYENVIGWMDFGRSTTGYVAFIIIGIILDRYRTFRMIAVLLNVSSTIVWTIFFLVLVHTDKLMPCVAVYLAVGVVTAPFWSSGIEQAAEMTYPVPEHTSSAVLIMISNVYAFLLTFSLGLLIDNGYLGFAGYFISGLYFVASGLAFFAKTDLLRSKAELHK